ncbi:hypothetical protein EV193_101857 [Herbihabitans rhizosphaerae]|uniref:Uncharacterized protein n=1 Tax=Herbihabitans rhizosphaerae TaxID=1872711 RepID=A0A4Q7L6S7_9PSEU|nr:hypothetical protein [Herbihabitans rhizosphaerae]RZS44976.1 hypothetical protein EV193_101857 [Herbihabitans rhizosphaerae]
MTREFASLRGRRVDAWDGVEMALRENGPQFEDPRVPCLQLLSVRASLDDDSAVSVTTYQNDAVFGLVVRSEAQLDEGHWDGIYRVRQLTELPTGRVEQVAVVVDEGVLAEVRLLIDARPLLLMAGELHETVTGDLVFHRLDESVLAFTDPAAADRVSWTPPRRGHGCGHVGGGR